jgi:hypothetical protein
MESYVEVPFFAVDRYNSYSSDSAKGDDQDPGDLAGVSEHPSVSFLAVSPAGSKQAAVATPSGRT